MNNEFDIAIIDTGLAKNSNKIDYGYFKGIHLSIDENGTYSVDDDWNDRIGHGTAVFHVIRNHLKDSKILVVRIFSEQMDTDTDLLVFALSYIKKYYKVHVINISNGVTCCNNIESLYSACAELVNDGTIIVSAFANSGAISYPAAFDNVLGVDMSLACKHVSTYEYVDDDLINLRAFGVTQKLPWVNNEEKRVSGTSFACPHIASIVYNIGLSRGAFSLRMVCDELKKNSVKQYEKRDLKERVKPGKIEKAVIFPFNKEVHSVVKFAELLNFDLVGVYDDKHMGNCGKKVSEIIGPVNSDYTICNIEELDWDDSFDTLILGHTRELSKAVSQDINGYIVRNCKKNNKKIFSFEDISKMYPNEYETGQLYTPIIRKDNVPSNRFGKLYKVGVPIICVTGTSVKQGKYTLQLSLRKLFMQNGYKVGGLGTEPSAELFGMSEVYPMGYDSSAYLDGQDEVLMVNELMHRVEVNDSPDVIIVGSQSQTVAAECDNLRYIPIHQNNFLYGCDADTYILVCNYFDSLDYIGKTLKYLEHFSYPDNNIAAIAVFPEYNDLQWSCLTGKKKFVNYEEAKIKADEIGRFFNIPTFVLGHENREIFDACIDFLSEE